jgi:pre-peptidase
MQWRRGGTTRSARRTRTVGALTLALALAGWAMPLEAISAPPATETPAAADPGACLAQNARPLPKSGLCTHGPDPVPPGKNIASDVPPVDPFIARVAPAAVCDGDGVTGKRVQVLYVRATNKPDRYSAYLESFRIWAAMADQIYGNSAADTGGGRHIRFVQEPNCAITVTPVTVSATGDDGFDNTVSELKQKGFNKTDRKYMLFVDANVYCGIGSIWRDDKSAATNQNNVGPSYGSTNTGCWGDGFTAAHELMHNLGGVQMTAPHTSGGWHCVDEWDVMCYSDTPNYPTMQIFCPDESLDRLDCRHDDYYSTNPPAGSYLATHWNTANSAFLAQGSTPPPPCPDAPFEPDDTALQARAVAVGSTETHAYCVPDDEDWVSFQATAGSSYSIETLNLASGNDTVLELYAVDRTTLLDFDDDSNGNSASLIDYTASTTGLLYVRSWNAWNEGGVALTYDLHIGTPPPCPDTSFEPDNTAGQARAVAVGVLETHAFCLPSDEDWVSFPASAGTVYRIETLNLASSTETHLQLYAGDRTTLLAEDYPDSGQQGSTIDFTATTSGSLYVMAANYFGTEGPHVTYDLRIRLAPPCPDVSLEPDNTVPQARAVSVGTTEHHAFCVRDDDDWVSFSASAGTAYRIETLNLASGNDTYLELYAADGTTFLADDDDSNGNLGSLINHTPGTSGTLYVRSFNFSGEGAPELTYDLRITGGGGPSSLLLNPSFELDANGDNRPDSWTSNAKFTRNATTVAGGSFSGQHLSTANANHTISQNVTVVAARPYTFSGQVNIPPTTDAFTFKLQIRWLKNTGATISTKTVKSYTAATGGWNAFLGTQTAPAGAVKASIRMVANNLKATIYVDAFNLQ